MKKIVSIVLAVLLVCSVAVACVACNTDGDKIYDKVTKTLKLSKSYEGKSFLTDGIGVATVNRFTDGDTTSFRLAKEGTVIALRYYSIDTPESTGGVEKWGKAASLFTQRILESATEIVLESSTGGAAEKDAYGTRYLGYVWYRTSPTDSFKCLNLQIVENGYSTNTGVYTKEYPYYTYFSKAQDAAEKNALHIFSNKDDPLYNDNPLDTTLKEINAKLTPNLEAYPDNDGYDPEYFNAELKSGVKVRFTAYIEDMLITNSGTYHFTAATYDAATGERNSIELYCMYANNPQSKLHLGGMYEITGSIQKNGTGFQISGIKNDTLLLRKLKDNSIETQKDYYLTFDSNVTSTDENYKNSFYTDVTVTEIVGVEDGVLTFKGRAAHKTNKTEKGKVIYDDPIEFTFTVKVGSDSYSKISVGASLKLHGYQLVSGSHNITIASLSAIQ